MIEIDYSLIDWSRAQFALTAFFHWFFIPLCIGLSLFIAVFETIYVKSDNQLWKKTTQFWIKIFRIIFVLSLLSGFIFVFQFASNWSNLLWISSDILSIPIYIGVFFLIILILSFATNVRLGWKEINKKNHLLLTWIIAISSIISMYFLMVTNAWMEHPTGATFNINTMRYEMTSYSKILFSPVAIQKFLHVISSSYIISSIFIIGISSWYLLKKRHLLFANKSIYIAALVGLSSSILIVLSGNISLNEIAKHQPMKYAAINSLYNSVEIDSLTTIGIINPDKKYNDNNERFLYKIEFPKYKLFQISDNQNNYIPGIKDLVLGNMEKNISSTEMKIFEGKLAIESLSDYENAMLDGDDYQIDVSIETFNDNKKHIGYGYLNDSESIIPNVPLLYYSFYIMILLSGYFVILFIIILFMSSFNKLLNNKIILKLSMMSIPLAFLSSMLGWVVSETGSQPWTILNKLPTHLSVSNIPLKDIHITFIILLVVFSFLLISGIQIIIRQINNGLEDDLLKKE